MMSSVTETLATMTMEAAPVTDGPTNLSTESSKGTENNDDANKSHGEAEDNLETHEVVEMQAFIERKAWIQEKTEMLEKMPPVEVFVGLDAVRESAEEVPGLPTRAVLQKWLAEHDRIEKETDVFDSGELQNLRQITKAAASRNMSPEDTDLIELTLTTILAVDKLLHLLRDRSDNLDLLGIRLTWEEKRIGAWVDRRTIIADLQNFLATRGRWSPDAYTETAMPPPPIQEDNRANLKRRNSAASLVSIASFASETQSLLASAGFSRAARFKMSETLSRDAANFATRVTTMRHGKVTAAGKALDKLIDTSRAPVPDELLDEQDRIEDMAEKEVEGIGKFAMSVVAQWKKADEFYVETMKDQLGAQTLLDELDTALLQHPTPRQDINFRSRAEVLLNRLSLRGNPSSPIALFPRPTHHLFPDQVSANDEIVSDLADEAASVTALARKAEAHAREYHEILQSVKRADLARKEAQEISAQFKSIIGRLGRGVESSHGDGTPPNLSSEACLEESKHSSFLALLPSILDELAKVDGRADKAIREGHAALLHLESPSIDSHFKQDTASEIEACTAARSLARRTRDDVLARAERLREARKVWSTIGETAQSLNTLRREISSGMEKDRWKQETGRDDAPPTPDSDDSAPALSALSLTPTIISQRVDTLRSRVAQDVSTPLTKASSGPDITLTSYLTNHATGLTKLMSSVASMNSIWQAIKEQASAMMSVRNDVHDLENKIENMKLLLTEGIRGILEGTALPDSLPDEKEVTSLYNAVSQFSASLSDRIPFISRHGEPGQSARASRHSAFGSGMDQIRAQLLQVPNFLELPFDLANVDSAVRNDGNAYTLRLSGGIASLEQKAHHLKLALAAKEIDGLLVSIMGNIEDGGQQHGSYEGRFQSLGPSAGLTQRLSTLRSEVDAFAERQRLEIGRCFSPVRELLGKMATSPGIDDPEVHDSLLVARTRAADEAERKLRSLVENATDLKDHIDQAHSVASTSEEIDGHLMIAVGVLDRSVEQMAALRSTLRDAAPGPGLDDELSALSATIEGFVTKQGEKVERSLSPVRELLGKIESSPSIPGSHLRESLLDAQTKALVVARTRLDALVKDSSDLKADVVAAQNLVSAGSQIDAHLAACTTAVASGNEHLNVFRRRLQDVQPGESLIEDLHALSSEVDVFVEKHHNSLRSSLSLALELLSEFESLPSMAGSTLREALFTSHREAVAGSQQLLDSFVQDSTSLRDTIAMACSLADRGKEIDGHLASAATLLARGIDQVNKFRETLQGASVVPGLQDQLTALAAEVEAFVETHKTAVEPSVHAVQELLSKIDGLPDVPNSALRASLSEGLTKRLTEARTRLANTIQESTSLSVDISAALTLMSAGKDIDSQLVLADAAIDGGSQQLATLAATLRSTAPSADLTTHLATLCKGIDELFEYQHQGIGSILETSNTLLQKMGALPVVNGSNLHEALLSSKVAAVNEAQHRLDDFSDRLTTLKRAVESAHAAGCLSEEIGGSLAGIHQGIDTATKQLEALTARLQTSTPSADLSSQLIELDTEVEAFLVNRPAELTATINAVRELLHMLVPSADMDSKDDLRKCLFDEQSDLVDAAEARLRELVEHSEELQASIAIARSAEAERLERERLADEAREKAERERLAAEELERQEKARLETERLEEDERRRVEKKERERLERECMEAEKLARLEKERLETEERNKHELERLEAEERARLEKERLDVEEQARVRQEEKERLEAEDRSRREEERFEQEKHMQDVQRQSRRQSKGKMPISEAIPEEDLFGPSKSSPKSDSAGGLQARILALRKRLRNLGLRAVAHPPSDSNSVLPSTEEHTRLTSELQQLAKDTEELPEKSEDGNTQTALKSLRTDIATSQGFVDRIGELATFSDAIALCDAALSDLLEHIDSYPRPPMGGMMSSHISDVDKPPAEQMVARLSFTEDSIHALDLLLSSVENDRRAVAERERIMQTWTELRDMAKDRMHGIQSPPQSVIDSGRNSRASTTSSVPSGSSKRSSAYSVLGRGGTPNRPSRGAFLKPTTPASVARRSVSDKMGTPRSVSNTSLASMGSRSTSGTFDPLRSTFASRQRTTSLSSTTSTLATPVKSRHLTPHQNTARSVSVSSRRIGSPTPSDRSSHSRMSNRSSSASHSTWSRAPRLSFGTPLGPKPVVPRTPVRLAPKTKYVANPKNKLDVAVGNVVNKMSINIKIEVASENWKDQSGKYWIGDQDPKLCFCRILRSQTVMVRVGGGWQELSGFIKGHFAESFRLMSESPTNSRAAHAMNEEKWISSATLLEAAAQRKSRSPSAPPKTPEPTGPYLPSFALSTPDGGSPRSLHTGTGSSGGSPGLMPLHYIRRASDLGRPGTPTRGPHHPHQFSTPGSNLNHLSTPAPVLGAPSVPGTPARNVPPTTPHRGPVWRP